MKNIVDYYELVFYIIVCQLIGVIGSFFNVPAIPDWYMMLNQPWFTPPTWIFPIVWPTLYLLLGIVWFRLMHAKKSKARKHAREFFFIQLILNALWSPIFFGAKAIDAALIVIVAMVITTVFAMVYAWKFDRVITYLLIPYIFWIVYATALNTSFVILN